MDISGQTLSEWEVVLLIDSREQNNATVQARLMASNVQCQLDTLSVGDFLWVARPKSNPNPTPAPRPPAEDFFAPRVKKSKTEAEDAAAAKAWKVGQGAVVLDCIVERKSYPDLGSSLMDQRYQQQKKRLKQTGIRVCLYIVEGPAVLPPQQTTMKIASLKTAMIDTHVRYSPATYYVLIK